MKIVPCTEIKYDNSQQEYWQVRYKFCFFHRWKIKNQAQHKKFTYEILIKLNEQRKKNRKSFRAKKMTFLIGKIL